MEISDYIKNLIIVRKKSHSARQRRKYGRDVYHEFLIYM